MAKKQTTAAESVNERPIPEGLRSLKLEVENFKKLQSTIIDIGGRSLMFVGPNESGKSTLIQAMMSPINSKLLPSEPIKQGETRARISHTIGGTINGQHKEYIMDLRFTDKNKSGTLTVKNELGEDIKQPATFIKNLVGTISFDVTQWLNDKPEQKLKTIKTLTGRGQDIDVATAKIKLEKENQKKAHDRAEELNAILSNHGLSNEDLEKYSTPIPLEPMQQAMSGISAAQQQWDGIKVQVDGFRQTVINSNNKINTANAEIFRLQEEIKRQQSIIDGAVKEADISNGNIATGEAWLNANPRPSVDVITTQINEAIAHNEKCNNVSQLQVHQRELLKCRETVEVKKAEIKKLEEERSKIIKESQLPIEGLTFDDETLYLDGLPLEAEQINTARLFDVGVEVAMSMNPTLKIIFLHDANVFDKKHLHAIIKKIEDRGYMAVCEFVSFEGEELEIKFTEEVLK